MISILSFAATDGDPWTQTDPWDCGSPSTFQTHHTCFSGKSKLDRIQSAVADCLLCRETTISRHMTQDQARARRRQGGHAMAAAASGEAPQPDTRVQGHQVLHATVHQDHAPRHLCTRHLRYREDNDILRELIVGSAMDGVSWERLNRHEAA